MKLRSAEYTIPRSLPACNVDVALLRELERYLLDEVPRIIQCDPGTLAAALEITFEENAGKLSIGTMEDHQGTFLSEELSQVEVSLAEHGTGIAARIVFSNGKLGGRLEITCKGSQARQNASEISDGLFRIIKGRRNLRFFSVRAHPLPELLRFLPLFPGLVFAAVAIAELSNPANPVKAVRFASFSILLFCFTFLYVIIPPFRFDHPTAKNRELIVKWILGTIGTAVIALGVEWIVNS